MLATMSLGLVLLSVLCFFAIMIASGAGADMSSGIWPAVGITVYIAPPLAIVAFATVIIMTFVRRSRANKAE
ncbi:hypothetical protein GCM10009808_14830 [Microbacterium sediminicola]|uniref:Multidrug ABC transporter ATPase n=1 Tax=Microbacterium sediminicola TaxID=415210 RepID=A0ABP4U7F6_9MICO